MSNPTNFGTVVGRLANDPSEEGKALFKNSDGSVTIKTAVYADNDYKNRDGSRGSVAVPVEAYFSKDAKGLGLFPFLGKGDLVAVTYSVRDNSYTKDGVKHYGIVLSVDSIQGLEPKSIVEARRAAAPAAGA